MYAQGLKNYFMNQNFLTQVKTQKSGYVATDPISNYVRGKSKTIRGNSFCDTAFNTF